MRESGESTGRSLGSQEAAEKRFRLTARLKKRRISVRQTLPERQMQAFAEDSRETGSSSASTGRVHYAPTTRREHRPTLNGGTFNDPKTSLKILQDAFGKTGGGL